MGCPDVFALAWISRSSLIERSSRGLLVATVFNDGGVVLAHSRDERTYEQMVGGGGRGKGARRGGGW